MTREEALEAMARALRPDAFKDADTHVRDIREQFTSIGADPSCFDLPELGRRMHDGLAGQRHAAIKDATAALSALSPVLEEARDAFGGLEKINRELVAEYDIGVFDSFDNQGRRHQSADLAAALRAASTAHARMKELIG